MTYAPADASFMSEGSPDVAIILTLLCAIVISRDRPDRSKQISRDVDYWHEGLQLCCAILIAFMESSRAQTDCIIGYMMGLCKGCKEKPDGCEAVQCITRQRAACAHAMGVANTLTVGS